MSGLTIFFHLHRLAETFRKALQGNILIIFYADTSLARTQAQIFWEVGIEIRRAAFKGSVAIP